MNSIDLSILEIVTAKTYVDCSHLYKWSGFLDYRTLFLLILIRCLKFVWVLWTKNPALMSWCYQCVRTDHDIFSIQANNDSLKKRIQSYLFVTAFCVYLIYINEKEVHTFYISTHFIYINEVRAYVLYIFFFDFL